MKKWTFAIRYESRRLVINGEATVLGDYDGPSKPEAMVRAALADPITTRVTLVHDSRRDEPSDADSGVPWDSVDPQ